MEKKQPRHTYDDLRQWQALPLSIKIRMTMERIRAWVNEFGEEGCYISFSGGKDSTVLLDIARNRCGYTNIPAVFVDVPTQYPELKEFVQTFDNTVIIKPKLNFFQVCEQYGFPLISKEASECVYYARKYVKKNEKCLKNKSTKGKDDYDFAFRRLMGTGEYLKKGQNLISKDKNAPQRILRLYGALGRDNENLSYEGNENGKRSNFNLARFQFFLDADFEISNMCCKVMKKEPAHRYAKETGRMPMTAQMADESRLRLQKWLQNGCNSFDTKNPISNPMSFWTEQDVLQYIVENELPICSVYGEVVEDRGNKQIDGQLTLADLGFMEDNTPKKYKCTGCERTGCVLCGFGCHMEKKSRFEMLKQTHPKFYAMLDLAKNNGITFREAIEWANEHGNLNIKV